MTKDASEPDQIHIIRHSQIIEGLLVIYHTWYENSLLICSDITYLYKCGMYSHLISGSPPELDGDPKDDFFFVSPDFLLTTFIEPSFSQINVACNRWKMKGILYSTI